MREEHNRFLFKIKLHGFHCRTVLFIKQLVDFAVEYIVKFYLRVWILL